MGLSTSSAKETHVKPQAKRLVELTLSYFEGYNISVDSAAKAVGEEIRRKWLLFVWGGYPWKREDVCV